MRQPVMPCLAKLAKNHLATIRLVAAVEVVPALATLCSLRDSVSGAPGIDATNHDVRVEVQRRLTQMSGLEASNMNTAQRIKAAALRMQDAGVSIDSEADADRLDIDARSLEGIPGEGVFFLEGESAANL